MSFCVIRWKYFNVQMFIYYKYIFKCLRFIYHSALSIIITVYWKDTDGKKCEDNVSKLLLHLKKYVKYVFKGKNNYKLIFFLYNIKNTFVIIKLFKVTEFN